MELQCQEEKPLRADSFKVREKSGWQRFQGRFFSKAVIATIVVLLIILVILVIVLGALLGKERASRGDEKSGKNVLVINPGFETRTCLQYLVPGLIAIQCFEESKTRLHGISALLFC